MLTPRKFSQSSGAARGKLGRVVGGWCGGGVWGMGRVWEGCEVVESGEGVVRGGLAWLGWSWW